MLDELLTFNWKLFLKRIYHKSKEVNIFINAMSLVYTTLLSIVPLLIFSFYIMTLFNFFGGMKNLIQNLKEAILKNLATGTGQIVVNFLEEHVNNVDIGQLGAISFFSLVVIIVFMLSRIEKTFNKIWGVVKHRDLFKRFIAFWTFITLGTFLITLFLSLILALVNLYFNHHNIAQLYGINKFGVHLISLITYFLIFISSYYFIPNTKVDPLAAIVGGITSGILFDVAKLIYKIYTKNIVTYHQIYGSLSVIPLFLIWLYVIWLITLLGAVVSYVFQHRDNLNSVIKTRDISVGIETLILISILIISYREYLNPKSGGANFSDFTNKINIPADIIEDNLYRLKERNLISVTQDSTYIPMTSLENISLDQISDLLIFDQEFNIEKIFTDQKLHQIYYYLKKDLFNDLKDLTIKDLLNNTK